MKLAWATDIHLDFASVDIFQDHIGNNAPDALLLTGDLSNGQNLFGHLEDLADLQIPVYFVLGNHDFYQSLGVAKQRVMIDHYTRLMGAEDTWDYAPQYLTFIPQGVELAPGTILVGHDGWYDAQVGTPETSNVWLNDWKMIPDFSFLNREDPLYKNKLVNICNTLGKIAAHEAKINLKIALKKKPHTIYFATHVPPFHKASTYKGKVSDNHWAPWFTNYHMGEMLSDIAAQNKDVHFRVLCGHSHGETHYEHFDNLEVFAGAAMYGSPKIHKIWSIE